MIVNRNFAKLLALFFFIQFGVLIMAITMSIDSNFSFSENPILRFVVLLICIFATSIFYGFIAEDEKTINGQDKGNFLIKGDLEYARLIPIIIVFGIALFAILWLIIYL